MKQICEKLTGIARDLGLSQVEAELASIISRQDQDNPLLVLPLVGEFSAGKTTLINALTDSKKLETATRPTTATIYEVHFGCDSCRATVLTAQGELVDYPDISALKNDELSDAKVVTVFDTSTKVPPTTILVDTPGLSSPDPKHKQTLVDFLPKADGILLVVDINQQVTRSLTDFIDMMKLSRKPIYLVLTMADTKSAEGVESAKHYIGENCKIPLRQIVVVSAVKGRLEELYALFAEIQQSKKEILSRVDEQRVKDIAVRFSSHIDDLLASSSSDSQLDDAIQSLQRELNRINRKIDAMIGSVSEDIQEQERQTTRKFEDTVQARLNALVAGKSANFDAEAVSMINNTSSLLLSEYKDSVRTILRDAAKSMGEDDLFMGAPLFADISLDGFSISGLSYGLDLNTMGHEYDEWIKTGVIMAAAVGAAALAAAAPAAEAVAFGASEATEAGVAIAGLDLIDIADTVTDVSSIVSNSQAVEKVQRAMGSTGEDSGRDAGGGTDLIGSLVGFATDNLLSKPQRIHAVRSYVESTLAPEFKAVLKSITSQLIADVRESLSSGAAQVINQKEAALRQLKQERRDKEDSFKTRIALLKEFKNYLSTINQQ